MLFKVSLCNLDIKSMCRNVPIHFQDKGGHPSVRTTVCPPPKNFTAIVDMAEWIIWPSIKHLQVSRISLLAAVVAVLLA